MHTVGIEYNKNIADWPKREVIISSLVVGFTFIALKEDEDEEEIKGYSVVNIVSVTEANAMYIKKPEVQKK